MPYVEMQYFGHDDALREVIALVGAGMSVRGACRRVSEIRSISEATLRSVFYRKVTAQGELVSDLVETQLQESESDLEPIEFTDSRPKLSLSRPVLEVRLVLSASHFAAARALGASDSRDLADLGPLAQRFRRDLPEPGEIVRLSSGTRAASLIQRLNPGHKASQLPTRRFPSGDYRFLNSYTYGRSRRVRLEKLSASDDRQDGV